MHKVDIERLLLKGFDSVGELVRANQFKCFRPRLSINLRSSELFAPALQCAAFSLSLSRLSVGYASGATVGMHNEVVQETGPI